MGVAGAAISTLVSRVFCMVVIFIALSKPKIDIVVSEYHKIRPDYKLIGSILAIGVPSGIENSMFQFGKLAIQSTVSTMGTAAIAAQAMTNILENVNGVFGIGVCKYPAFINKVILLCRVPPFHPVPASGVILRELHQTQVGKIVRVHINKAYSQISASFSGHRTGILQGCRS